VMAGLMDVNLHSLAPCKYRGLLAVMMFSSHPLSAACDIRSRSGSFAGTQRLSRHPSSILKRVIDTRYIQSQRVAATVQTNKIHAHLMHVISLMS
jgi:hypothetical protein